MKKWKKTIKYVKLARLSDWNLKLLCNRSIGTYINFLLYYKDMTNNKRTIDSIKGGFILYDRRNDIIYWYYGVLLDQILFGIKFR